MRFPISLSPRLIGFAALFLTVVLIASPAGAQMNFGGFSAGGDETPSVSVRAEIRPGTSPTRKMLYVEATVLPGRYIYAIDTPKGVGPVPTEIRVTPTNGVNIGEFRALKAPKTKYSEAFETEIRTQQGKVAWAAPVEFSSQVSPEKTVLRGAVFAQACAKDFCTRPQEYSFTSHYVAGGASRDVYGAPSSVAGTEAAHALDIASPWREFA